MESQGMNHQCSCCRALEVENKMVLLPCANGKSKEHYYKEVVRCGCSAATCEPIGSAELQQQQQQEQQNQQQWSQSTSRGRVRRRWEDQWEDREGKAAI